MPILGRFTAGDSKENYLYSQSRFKAEGDVFIDLLVALGVALAINLAMFVVAFKFQTDKLTDISYAVTFVVLVLYGLLVNNITASKLAAVIMVCVWSTRLGGFLLYRIRKTGRDKRFDGIRENFKKFLQFWVLQGISVWVILMPTLLLLSSERTVFDLLGVIGLLVWGTGLYVEATADIQKYHFSQSPANKNKWIDSGIWRFSRHPNYFGEILVWIGMYLFAAMSLSLPQVVLAAISPLFITSLLLFISGIPKLEKGADERWGDDPAYREYKRRTSLLLPAPKKPAKNIS